MDRSLLISPAPHVRSPITTQRIMLDVIIALLPTLVASVWIFGWQSLAVTAVCVLTCVVCEWGFEKICHRDVTVGDLSAVVTGIILAFNLPATIPLWQAAFGALVAIVVVKQLFGGIGKNFANPAATARIVLFLSFSGTMSAFPKLADAVSSATPLAQMNAGESPALLDLLLGRHGGCLGETCALTLILGGVYLLFRRVITWHAPVALIATVFLSTWALGADPLHHVLSGGVILAAFFMITDYATSPSTAWGKILFGVGCGLITVLIRLYGNYPEGMSFAILLMNILTPYLCTWTRKRPFGGVKAKKA